MKSWSIKFSLILLLFIGGMIILSGSTKMAGTGPETTNGIVGYIINEDGSPTQITVVKLLPSYYDSLSNADNTPELIDINYSEVLFRFTSFNKGEYSIITRYYQCTTCVLIPLVKLEEDNSIVNISQCQLLKGRIIAANFKESKNLTSGYLYIPGRDIFLFIDTNGYVEIRDIPAGKFVPVVHNFESKRNNILHKVITIKPESITVIHYSYWYYERRIVLNTKEEGVGIDENNYDFLVLIRLNKNYFDFTKVSSSESDLRFTKTDVVPLPFEIKRWNILQKQGEIRVRVDTIYVNDSLQSIVMYRGNSIILNQPYERRRLVFDNANGFRGEWHLSDIFKDTLGDVTYYNHFDGISTKNFSPSITNVVIEESRYFDGTSKCIKILNSADGNLDFSQNDRYTISAWIYLENFDSLWHVILSKVNIQYFLCITLIHLNFMEVCYLLRWEGFSLGTCSC